MCCCLWRYGNIQLRLQRSVSLYSCKEMSHFVWLTRSTYWAWCQHSVDSFFAFGPSLVWRSRTTSAVPHPLRYPAARNDVIATRQAWTLDSNQHVKTWHSADSALEQQLKFSLNHKWSGVRGRERTLNKQVNVLDLSWQIYMHKTQRSRNDHIFQIYWILYLTCGLKRTKIYAPTVSGYVMANVRDNHIVRLFRKHVNIHAAHQ